MSLTPVERNGEEGRKNRELACDQRQGVRARVRSWLQSIGQQIRNFYQRSHDSDGGSPPPERLSEQQGGEIRVSGQRRLADPQQSSTRDTKSAELSIVRPELPSTSGGDTERDGNRLHNPNQPDAYITSDTWEDIER